MGRKRSEKGGRRGAGRRSASPRDQGRSDASQNRAGAGGVAPGPSRLRLTRLLREGGVWDVYVATTAQAGASNVTRLEFEGRDAQQKKVRYNRPVEGDMLDALHSGAPLSRARLDQELDLAIREAEAVGGGNGAVPAADRPADRG